MGGVKDRTRRSAIFVRRKGMSRQMSMCNREQKVFQVMFRVRHSWVSILLLIIHLDASSQLAHPEHPKNPMAPTAVCKAGTPPEVFVSTFFNYVQLNYGVAADSESLWNFKSFLINRIGPDHKSTRVAEITHGFGGQFIDAVPDPRGVYQYVVSDMRWDGCYSSTTVTAGPFKLLNPSLRATRAAAPDVVHLVWDPDFGAIKYRIDGPGLPSTGLYLGNATFVPGANYPNFPASSFGVTTSRYCNTCPPEFVYTLPDPGPEQLTYRIVAMYPGNFADYDHPGQTVVPAIPVCTATVIAPQDGPAGTSVTIDGANFFFVKQVFRLDQSGNKYVAAPFNVVSSSTIATTSAFDGPFKIETPAGTCTTYSFTVTPAPPPTKVTVPSVVGKYLKDARQTISQASLVPKLVAGPGLDTSLVNSEVPSFGVQANPGSEVDLTTYAGGPTGISKLVLLNDLEKGLALSMFDTSSGQLSTQNGGNLLQPGQTTSISFANAALYLVYGFDPTNCNDPVSCFVWQRGWYGDPNGPTASGSMSGNP